MTGTLKNIWKIIWPPLLFLAVGNAVAFIYTFVLYEIFLEKHNVFLPFILWFTTVGLVMFLIFRRQWQAEAFWSFGRVKAAPVLMCVPLAISMNFLTSGVIALLPINTELPADVLFREGNFVLLFIIAGLIAPFIEEIVFRGIVQKRLIKITKKIPAAIILQGVIFGFMHFHWLQGTYTAVAGIIIGVVYLWHDSIWVPILLHVVNNLASVIMLEVAGDTEFPLLFYVIMAAAGLAGTVASLFMLYGKRERGKHDV